jgi:hypothetical protein
MYWNSNHFPADCDRFCFADKDQQSLHFHHVSDVTKCPPSPEWLNFQGVAEELPLRASP